MKCDIMKYVHKHRYIYVTGNFLRNIPQQKNWENNNNNLKQVVCHIENNYACFL